VVREICALPADAVAISRRLLKLPTEDLVRRMDQEDHFSESECGHGSIAAFQNSFCERKVAYSRPRPDNNRSVPEFLCKENAVSLPQPRGLRSCSFFKMKTFKRAHA